MSSDQCKRLEGYCKTIWGEGDDYEFDVETDDYEYYQIFVGREQDGRLCPLTATSVCCGEESAWRDLERMLQVWATQVETGKPMTKEQKLTIFGGPRGDLRDVIELVDRVLAEKLLESMVDGNCS
ncbi:Hypothetical protein R9X50_00533800 [Acrodontium crateriforme]|uniref:Uncharacterized protein n=1 Tax=Acrodontium crateriforme TaxID=150365 RepID=A0AAQ3R919_9PEZI|nr:Hypothetical protein R9X50_00533800 [Acrodontium crateriforme]